MECEERRRGERNYYSEENNSIFWRCCCGLRAHDDVMCCINFTFSDIFCLFHSNERQTLYFACIFHDSSVGYILSPIKLPFSDIFFFSFAHERTRQMVCIAFLSHELSNGIPLHVPFSIPLCNNGSLLWKKREKGRKRTWMQLNGRRRSWCE